MKSSARILAFISLLLTACVVPEGESLKSFPFAKLEIVEADIRSSLDFNPHREYPPRQRFHIGIGISPINLGSDATAPDLETTVDSPIVITDMELPITTWQDLPGRYRFEEPHQGGSFYVTHRHNPVDVRSLEIRHLEDNRFHITLDLDFVFSFEGSGYRDESLTLSFEAAYTGFSFLTPPWSTPEEIEFPSEWAVPSKGRFWRHEELREFVGRYVDLTAFSSVTVEDTSQHSALEGLP